MPRGVYIRTEDNKKNIGKSKKGNTPWNKGKKGLQSAWNKGVSHTEETKKKVSETKKSQNRKMTDSEKKRLSEYNKSIGKKPPVVLKGDKCHFWRGGISFEKYPVDWSRTLRISIRERDNYTCQLCGEKQGDEAMSVHHIDYNKTNCNPDNLTSLCRSCHGLTAKNRNYWTDFFKVCSQKQQQHGKSVH